MWFQGKAVNAISEAHDEKAMLIVFIKSDNDESIRVGELWNNLAVKNACDSINHVAIQFYADSQDGKQFSSVYPVVMLPCIYMISERVALEIMVNDISSDSLAKKLTSAYKLHQDNLEIISKSISSENMPMGSTPSTTQLPTQPTITTPIPSTPTPSTPTPSTPTASTATPSPKLSTPTSIPTTSTPSIQVASSSVATPTPAGTIDLDQPTTSSQTSSHGDGMQALERAKELVKMQNSNKTQEDKKTSKKNEMDRRQIGKEMANFKEMQKLEQMKDDVNSWKKDKLEDAIAREKVKAQIALDRAARSEKYNKSKVAQQKISDERLLEKQMAAEAAKNVVDGERMKFAVLNFRLIDGSSITQKFSSSQPLSAVKSFIDDRLGSKGVRLSTIYPKRDFTDEDASKTLMQLTLAPNAVVHAIPADRPRGSVVSASDRGSFLNLLLSPFFYMWSWVKYFFLSPPKSTSTRASSDAGPSSQQTPDTRSSLGGLEKHQIGNVTTFRSKVDDDTENATDNGNSSQQL